MLGGIMRILFAGHDFKFATGIIKSFESLGWETLIDKWDNHNRHDIEKSFQLLKKADVVFCEWGLGNSVFYSQNKLNRQILIVRMHAQEKNTDYLFNADFSKIDLFISIAPFIYEELVCKFKLPREKTKLIYNQIDFSQFKYNPSHRNRYNLGICGITPKLKRLDLALDIFEKLYAKDNQYKLFIKGKNPLDFEWVKKNKEECKYYNEVFERIRRMKNENIIFDGYSDNIANWYKKIGYILSLSDQESFHMAVIEGAASGAIPAILQRDGAYQLFPKEFIFKDTDSIIEFIYRDNDYELLNKKVKILSEKYSSENVNKKIFDELIKLNHKTLITIDKTTIQYILAPVIKRLRNDKRKKLIIMSTGIKPPHESKNHQVQYRGASIANELVNEGYEVIILYYNWHKNVELPFVQGNPCFLPAEHFIYDYYNNSDLNKLSNEKVLITTIPDKRNLDLIELVKKERMFTIYDIWDDWEEMARMGMGRSWYDKTTENKVCLLVDRVCAVSDMLKEKAHNEYSAKKTKVIPNGVSTDFVDKTKSIFIDSLYKNKPKKMGYFGHLGGNWFDWENLFLLANKFKDWQFELIGPGYPKDLSYPENIALLGPKTHDDLIEIAKYWQIGLIPFGMSKLEKSVDPIKVYEYLALGLKVVSADIGRVNTYPLTWVYHDGSELLIRVKEAIVKEKSNEMMAKVEKFINNNTWKIRTLELIKEEKY